MSVKLQVAICTFGHEGLKRVSELVLPELENVAYLVSCQCATVELPESLRREDIKVVFSPTKGLSNNRNNALSHVTSPYVLIADDDLEFYPEGLAAIIDRFDSDPRIDIATFRADTDDHKDYPERETDIWMPPKGYWISSVEIALRMESVRGAGLSFNPNWGLGSETLHSGEENIFLLMARKSGLNGRFFPVTIVRHRGDSTGTRLQESPGVLMAQGAYFVYAYPYTCVVRLLLKAKRTTGGFLANCRNLFLGAMYALAHKDKLLR